MRIRGDQIGLKNVVQRIGFCFRVEVLNYVLSFLFVMRSVACIRMDEDTFQKYNISP